MHTSGGETVLKCLCSANLNESKSKFAKKHLMNRGNSKKNSNQKSKVSVELPESSLYVSVSVIKSIHLMNFPCQDQLLVTIDAR